MNYIQQLHNYSKGDTLQGWVMLSVAVLLVVLIIGITKSINPLLRGMLVPLILLLMMNLGYGGYLVFKKPKNVAIIEQQSQKHPNQIENKLSELQKEGRSYATTKTIWAVLLIVSVFLYFVFARDYYKGVTLGFMVMFLGMLIIDAFLHHRLKEYVLALKGFI